MSKIYDLITSALEAPFELFRNWLEWQDAKSWAKEYHPGWLQIAQKARTKETRQIYRDKIIKAYQGELEDVFESEG